MSTLILGPSLDNVKKIWFGSNFPDNNYYLSPVETNGTQIKISVKFKQGRCTIQRVDQPKGWDLLLTMEIPSPLPTIPPTTTPNNFPIYYLNLAHDTDRRTSITNTLTSTFPGHPITRIPGVRHRFGVEGCRLSHIDAHITAVGHGHQYYLVCEDDIVPCSFPNSADSIDNYIYQILATPFDVVMLESGCDIERRIKLQRSTPNLYRVYGGGNNLGCYLCHRDFGLQLIKYWYQQPKVNCDHSLFRFLKHHSQYRGYLHRPCLFRQHAGKSNVGRNRTHEAKLFNWELYDRLHSSD